MENRLVEYGDGVAIVLGISMLERLDITFETPLGVYTHDGVLIITPVHKVASRSEVEEAIKWTNQHYERALKRLAE